MRFHKFEGFHLDQRRYILGDKPAICYQKFFLNFYSLLLPLQRFPESILLPHATKVDDPDSCGCGPVLCYFA